MKANEIGLPTFEAEVSCGAYCQGGLVNMKPTTYPEFEDAEFVWVRGDDAARLAARLAEAERLLAEAVEYGDFYKQQSAELMAKYQSALTELEARTVTVSGSEP